MLEKELNFFVSNQTDLVASYKGKVLVIKGQKVVGVYKDALEAYFEAQKQYELGTFMLQPCEPGEEAYTVFITSNELFKQKQPEISV